MGMDNLSIYQECVYLMYLWCMHICYVEYTHNMLCICLHEITSFEVVELIGIQVACNMLLLSEEMNSILEYLHLRQLPYKKQL